MAKAQYMFIRDGSSELKEELSRNGPIQCLQTLPVYLTKSPSFDTNIGGEVLFPRNIEGINRNLDLAVTFNETTDLSLSTQEIRHQLNVVAAALQLVKPTPDFSSYWIE